MNFLDKPRLTMGTFIIIEGQRARNIDKFKPGLLWLGFLNFRLYSCPSILTTRFARST